MSFRAPAPRPHAARPNLLRLLAILRDNPLEAWTTEHFERPIVRDGLPFMPAVVVNDPAAIQRVLLDNASNYARDQLLRRILAPALSNGLLTADGEQWRRQRRAVAPMFSRKTIASYAPAMKDAADALVERLLHHPDGAIVDMAQEATYSTLDVLQRTIFSEGLGRSTEDYRTQMRRYFDSIGRIDPFDVLGLPSFLPRWTKWRAQPAMRFFDNAVKTVIAKRRRMLAEHPQGCPNDILTLLLEARDPETGQELSDEELRANTVTLIAAGHETTANALSWSLFLLSQVQPWQERVASEGRQMLAHRGEPATEHLVITRAIIEEALRLYPPIAAITRVAIGPDELACEPIRKGTMIIVAPYLVHRHRRLWEHPETFEPSRFFGENRQAIHRYAYLPFGAGPHICLGAAFALQEAAILLASVTAHFSFRLAPGFVAEPLLRITLRPRNGLPMVLVRRSSAPLRAMPSSRQSPEPPRQIRMAS